MQIWPFGKKEKPVADKAPSSAGKSKLEADKPLTYREKRLLETARKGDSDGIKESLLAGANPNVRILGKDETALMLACLAGPDATEGVQALLNAGADVRATMQGGMNALLLTASICSVGDHYSKNAEPLIDALIAAGARVDDGLPDGRTPLFMTVNDTDIISSSAVRALLKHGADPNVEIGKNPDLLLSMVWSISRSRDTTTIGHAIAAIKAMVEAGAKVNPCANPVGNVHGTPIGAAACSWHPRTNELVTYLIEHGANADVVDNDGTSLVQTMRLQLDKQLVKGEPIESTLSLIEILETSIMRGPDGKGQKGSAEQQVNPTPSHHHIG